jgi:hypothetical protein
MWTTQTVVSRIDGAKIVIRRWSGRVQSATTLCSGLGASARWGNERHWRHFTCTWTPVERSGRVDRDVTFRVHALHANRFRITDPHFGSH